MRATRNPQQVPNSGTRAQELERIHVSKHAKKNSGQKVNFETFTSLITVSNITDNVNDEVKEQRNRSGNRRTFGTLKGQRFL